MVAMEKEYSRRMFIGTALAGLAGAAFAEAPESSLRPRMRPVPIAPEDRPSATAIIEATNLDGEFSVAVADVVSGAVLDGYGESIALPPASVAKTVTTLYALHTLGKSHRFTTRLYVSGKIEGGEINGDLILAGGGDPTLDTADLQRMAEALKQAGVTAVNGRFLVWGGALPFQAQINAEQPQEASYNPAISGLNLNFNRVFFKWERKGDKYQISMDARAGGLRPAVRVSRMRLTDQKTPVYSYRDAGGHDDWSVAEIFLGEEGGRWLPVRKPELYAAEVFASLARDQGIALPEAEMSVSEPLGRILVTHESAPLSVVLRDMLKYSTNLTAEIVGMMSSQKRLGRQVTLPESAREMSAWARSGLGMSDVRLVDHSGLGASSDISAASLISGLVHRDTYEMLAPLLREYTIKHEELPAVQVIAKTGTLYFVSGFAGYFSTSSGRKLAFVFFGASEERRRGFDPSVEARPPGAAGWNARAKVLQWKLIQNWALRHDKADDQDGQG